VEELIPGKFTRLRRWHIPQVWQEGYLQELIVDNYSDCKRVGTQRRRLTQGLKLLGPSVSGAWELKPTWVTNVGYPKWYSVQGISLGV